MILLYAVVIGVIAGLLRTQFAGTNFSIPPMRGEWLILVAIIPQVAVFFLPGVRRSISREGAAITLVFSQTILLIFVWMNWKRSGFWLLGLGLILNLGVIALNGGLMPISPQTVLKLAPDAPIGELEIGGRIGGSKDVLLPEDETRAALLSDRFVFPAWFPQRVAFSLGDGLVAIGVIWFFWQAGGSRNDRDVEV